MIATAPRLALALAASAALAGAAARATAAPPGAPPTAPPARADLAAPRPGPGAHGGDTDCGACHTADGWKAVTFAHERTGFPLDGRHRDAQCRACHAGGTFADPVPRACAACHRDVHGGRLGPRCASCHDPTAWSTPTFGPEAHRRTAFPLTGRHALVACESCHGDRRDRAFARPTSRCIACHEADWARAGSAAAAVNHDLAGFPQDCRGCHGAWRFSPAGLPAHETCFSIKSGPHAGIRCKDCHASFPAVDYAQPFTCATDTADCLRCHGNVAGEHDGVAGFQLVNRKCYECHRFSAAFGGLHGTGVPR
ncbi:cytochrome c family protein [Anaeromyxobacter dehalogenans 2CP-1]|uniref:Cytochrome c family protein n=1 Tax=Anaeromyxobacter dehalogenans (strain ATCC BAA-258 / DSM 21875 / 2CP-1) TaxID=455488 RepID=B8JEP1_ANAD2|nr:hypothetical protein [Anaeromyxobacter dehalogenans]ACL66187.1 cytochrome c family protein [Anaeromyxobacter dehalogenans 2CP-1]